MAVADKIGKREGQLNGVDVHSLTASQARAAAGALRGPAGGNGRGGQEGW